jgi:hypothetical protein
MKVESFLNYLKQRIRAEGLGTSTPSSDVMEADTHEKN